MHLLSRTGSTSSKRRRPSSSSRHDSSSSAHIPHNPLKSVYAGLHAKTSIIRNHRFLSANKALFDPFTEQNSKSSERTSSHTTEQFAPPQRQSLNKFHSSSSTSKPMTRVRSPKSSDSGVFTAKRKSIFFDKNAPTSSESERESSNSVDSKEAVSSFVANDQRRKASAQSKSSSVSAKPFRKSIFVSESAEASSSENEETNVNKKANASNAFRKSIFQSESVKESTESSDELVSFHANGKSERNAMIKAQIVSESLPMSSSISVSKVIKQKKLNKITSPPSSTPTVTDDSEMEMPNVKGNDALKVTYPTGAEMNSLRDSIVREKKLLEKERQKDKLSLQNELKQLDDAHAADMKQKDDVIKELKQNVKMNESRLNAKNAEIKDLNKRLSEYKAIEQRKKKDESENERLLKRKTMQIENEQSKVEELRISLVTYVEKCEYLQNLNKQHVTKMTAMKMMLKARNSKIKSSAVTIGLKEQIICEVEKEVHKIDDKMQGLKKKNDVLESKINEQYEIILAKKQLLRESNDKLKEKELLIDGLNDELKYNQNEIKKSMIVIEDLRADKMQMDRQSNEMQQMEMDKMKMEMKEMKVSNVSHFEMIRVLKVELQKKKSTMEKLKQRLSEKDVNMNKMKIDFRKSVRIDQDKDSKMKMLKETNKALLKRIQDMDDAMVANAQKVSAQMKASAQRETYLIGEIEQMKEKINEKDRLIMTKNDRLEEMEQSFADQRSHFTKEMIKTKSYKFKMNVDERGNNPQTVNALKKRICELTESMNAMQRQNIEISKRLCGYIHEVNDEMTAKNQSKSELDQLKKRFEKVKTRTSSESNAKDAMIQDLQTEIKEIGYLMGDLAQKLIGFDELKHAHNELTKRYKKQNDKIRKLEYSLRDYTQRCNNACFENDELKKEVSICENTFRSKNFEILNQNKLIEVLKQESQKMRVKLNENSQLKSKLARYENENNVINNKMKQNEQEIADLRLQISAKMMNLREISDERDALLDKMKKQNLDIKLKQNRLNELIPKQRKLEREVAYLSKTKEVNEDEIERLQNMLERQIGKMTAEINEKNKKMNDLMKWNKKYKHSQDNEVIEMRNVMNAEKEVYIGEIEERLRDEMSQSKYAMEKMQNKMKEKDVYLERMMAKYGEMSNELAGQKLKTEMTNIELNDIKQELKDLVAERDRLKAETRRLQSRLNKLAT